MLKQKTRRRLQNIGVIILIAACLGWVVYRFWGFSSPTYTDNAQVERLIVPVNSRVEGFITKVLFEDYSYVHKGDTLVIIDDAEYALRLAQANADYADATAGRSAHTSSISTTMNNVQVNEAAIAESQVLLDNAERDLQRYEGLLAKGAVTQQQYDGVKAGYEAMKAKHTMLMRQRKSTSMVGDEQKVRLGQTDARIAMAEAAIHLAELNLSYTVVTAPCDGYCSRCSIHVGQLVHPGQTLVDIVDANDVWVTANYREKQTSRMAVGDSVEIKVDAVPGVTYHGTVSDISSATGRAYEAPAEAQAVGNFVKIEQRIPVKVRFDKAHTSAEDLGKLRAGMNVECKVIK